MRAACVDFDGTIVEYSGFAGDHAIGPPLDGALDALRRLKREGYRVVVFTCRKRAAVEGWLVEHGMEYVVDEVTDRKPIDAAVFFDDRARHVTTNTPLALAVEVDRWLATEAIAR